MSATELVASLYARGISLEPRGDTLRVIPRNALTDELREAILANKAALLALLEPARDARPEPCPRHWQHIPELPAKGSRAMVADASGSPARYRVSLFGRWYLLRFEPSIGEMTVAVADVQATRRMFADLDEFYRWAWAERYAAVLSFRDMN